MIQRLILPVLSIAGLVLVVVALMARGNTPNAASAVGSLTPPPPPSSVACVGRVEASTGNVAVATPVAGVITAVFVRWGDTVKAGDPLFQIDTRDLDAHLPVARAHVREAKAKADNAAWLLRSGQGLSGEIVSAKDIEGRRAADASEQAALAARRAEVTEIEAQLERRTVRSPLTGRVLALRARAGEWAATHPTDPLVVVGDDSRLFLRAEVDELEAWRVVPGATATARVHGDPSRHASLRFERIEPMVTPKTIFSGTSTERSDTRVLPVVYSFDPAELPAWIGQSLDVYISADPP